MFNFIKKIFRDAAEAKARRKKQIARETAERHEKNLVWVNGRVNIRKRIEEELSPENCPTEEIVSRFQSIIEDKHFRKFIQSPTNSKRGFYFELSESLEKEGFAPAQYTNDSMVEFFIEAVVNNAHRISPDHAVNLINTLIDSSKSDAFSMLDHDWSERDDGRLTKHLLAGGLVPLAAQVPDEDKVRFFHACESEVFLNTMAEFGNPEDYAALMFNIFSDMKAGDVDDILLDSSAMALVPIFSNQEKLKEAFDNLFDPALANVIKSYIGHKPAERLKLSPSNG